MAIRSLFRRITAAPNTTADLEPQLEALESDLAGATRLLAESQATYGDAITRAATGAEVDRIESDLGKLRRDVDRLHAARGALERRLRAARDAEGLAERQERVRAWEAASARTSASLAAMQDAIAKAGAAVQSAQDAAQAEYAALPERTLAGNGQATPHVLPAAFVDLGDYSHRLLNLAWTRPEAQSSVIADLRERPTPLQEHASHALFVRELLEFYIHPAPAAAPELPTAA